MTIGNILGFLDLVFLSIVCVFLWQNLEKLTFKIKDQYPDVWIALGSVRFSKDTANSPDDPWYAWINFRALYKFITLQHSKLADKEVEKLVSSIKKKLLLLIILIVLMVRILYL